MKSKEIKLSIYDLEVIIKGLNNENNKAIEKNDERETNYITSLIYYLQDNLDELKEEEE